MKINNIDHIFVICSKEKEQDKYNKWLKWMEFNDINKDYVSFYCYKWGTELTNDDLVKYSNDDGTLVRLFPFRQQFPLKRSEISLGINFLNVFKLFLQLKSIYLFFFTV